MADDLTPSEIRARKFAGSRRGFDRVEVTDYLASVADRVGSLEQELTSVLQRLNQLGITELPDLKAEMDDLGSEIQNVLDAAMNAAEGLRSRAHVDAKSLVDEATEVSQTARGSAWETGTELLLEADAAAGRTLSEAREDALFIRAEAEQDAKRLISDARRQADEMLRSSRDDGERIVVIAKAESEAILEGARQSAEKAQKRARALENRRSELLGELEAAESAIREIESAQSDSADVGTPVYAPDSDERLRWPEDDGAVRILPAADPATPDLAPAPVDAEAMAAEVAQMRSAVTLPQSVEAEEPVAEAEPEVSVAEVTPEPVSIVAEEAPDPDPQPEPDLVPEEEMAPAEPELEQAVAEEPVPAGPVLDEPVATEPSVTDKVTVVGGDPGIEALFAKLRHPLEELPPDPVMIPAEIIPESAPSRAPSLEVVPPIAVGGGFDRRDRMLLPIENRGLRGLKRRIVELQNRVLEELRTSDGRWRLGREFVAQMMGDELDAVLRDSFQAGHAAAAESIGNAEPQVTGGPKQGAAESFIFDLHRDVQGVLDRDSDGGSRRLNSDVRRVFRGWRTDEAERHVRQAARRAFNDGLLAGYARLGVEEVEVAAPGRVCGECGADTGLTWKPGEELPAGVRIPPAGPSCEAMIVLAGSNGFDSLPEQ
ncbi:MAG: DivIVA domain-containing protein [bacterium]|nr:DivIVA domain-containing protein [bacterium]